MRPLEAHVSVQADGYRHYELATTFLKLMQHCRDVHQQELS